MRPLRTAACVLSLVPALAACGGVANSRTTSPPPSSAPASTTPPRAAVVTTAFTPVTDLVATASAPLAVYTSMNAATPARTLAPRTAFGSPTTLLVHAWQGRDGRWLQVALPTRPNGSSGFVHASDVQLSRVDQHIDVDLAARRLRVFDATDRVVLDTPVAVGSMQNPTPAGDYFVTDVLDTRNGGGAYGPFALGLSAHSNTLSEFDGGDGEIGIHGTDNPGSIGHAVSHGCVRVGNDVVTRLAGMIALGTPVAIH